MSLFRITAAAVSAAAGFALAAPLALESAFAAGDARQSLFVITDQEGYGTGECLDRQGGCGRIIADSFCESKGFRLAAFYRRATTDDVTGSIASERKPAPRDPSAFVIGCK